MRYELTDYEWTAIKPMLPNKPRGVPRANDRRVLNGIFWVLRSGAPWRDLPNAFGPYTTCYNHFVRWGRAGVWARIMNALAGAHDTAVQMIDTSIVRVHQHGACIMRNRQQSMGRSRGGLTSKIHAVVDTNGLPVRFALTAGEAHDNRLAGKLLSRLTSETMLLADRGYDADWIRVLAAKKGAWANIPPRCNRKEPICFSPYLYRARNLVERFFNKIKHCRRVATRYDKLAANYLAFVQLASIRLWLRSRVVHLKYAGGERLKGMRYFVEVPPHRFKYRYACRRIWDLLCLAAYNSRAFRNERFVATVRNPISPRFRRMWAEQVRFQQIGPVDPKVAAVGPSQLLQPLLKRPDAGLRVQIVHVYAPANERANAADPVWLLRARNKWPRHCRTAEKSDELAPSLCLPEAQEKVS